MAKRLRDLDKAELDAYCAEIARAGEAARVVGIPLPAAVEHAAAVAAAEVADRWGPA
jgi:hypothetical protein